MVQISLILYIFKIYTMGAICKVFVSEGRGESCDSAVGRVDDCCIHQTDILKSIFLIPLTRLIFNNHTMGDIYKILGSAERCESRESSFSRAEDCSINQNDIIWSMVRIRLTR